MGSNVELKKQRLVGLDLFRICIVLIVFLFHSIIHFNCYYGILQYFLSMGAICMTGFYILSGFILYYTYENKDFCDIKNIGTFYKKRVVSILPVYYFVALIYILFLGKETNMQNLILAPIELLGLQSAFSSLFMYSHNGGTWFISCIICCYFLFPFLVQLVKKSKLKTKLICFFIMIFILIYSPFVVKIFNLNDIYSNIFFRVLEFSIGIILCDIYLCIYRKICVKQFVLIILCLIETVTLFFSVKFMCKFNFEVGNYMAYSLICLPIFILIIFTLAMIDFKRLKGKKLIFYLSDISYCFFLSQFFVWYISKLFIDFIDINNDFVRIAVSIITNFLISVTLHHIIEKPLKKIIKNIFKRD